MTKREFTSIILKLMGVYTLLTYLTQFTVGLVIAGNMIKQNGSLSKNSIEAIAFLLIPICFYIIVPALLIVKSNWVACRLIKNDGEFSLGFTITKEELLTVAFCCIGLITMVTVIPKLTQSISQILLTSTDLKGVMNSSGLITRYSTLVAYIVQAVIGLSLFLQARGLTNLWHKLRNYKGPVSNLPEN
ncbi:MAG: hypothetical protein KAG98_06480 [Lentisphaeria bacterium]|nr:hypothetical protein [Lentisphaeria bacterium]